MIPGPLEVGKIGKQWVISKRNGKDVTGVAILNLRAEDYENAVLFAAAPDLLEAAERIAADIASDSGEVTVGSMVRLCAAIAKAKGESP